MPILGCPLIPFTTAGISQSPEAFGVYALHQHGELIYYGRAARVTIRQRLASHYSGAEGPCTQAATHFQYEVCSNPEAREVQLLEEFRRQFGRLPRCNDRVG